jgi:hypothetical protein
MDLRQIQPLVDQAPDQLHEVIRKIIMRLDAEIEQLTEELLAVMTRSSLPLD